MARYFNIPFANQGDKVVFPDGTQADGSISYNQGYGPDYQRNPATDSQARRLERDRFNQLAFDITSTLQLYYQNGVPPFITTADNGGTAFPYEIYSRVRYNPGTGERVYESLINNNTNLPTVTSAWRLVDITALDAAYLSQSEGDARYLQGTLGQAAGNIPQIGAPATAGRSAVVVNAGSNANGGYRVWSDGLIYQFRDVPRTGSGHSAEEVDITFPIPFTTLNTIVVLTSIRQPNTATRHIVNSSFQELTLTGMQMSGTGFQNIDPWLSLIYFAQGF